MNLGRYEILGELGRGGMGVVYRARDAELDREVVIKLVSGALEPKGRARFEREADALGQLRHPNLVPVHDQGLDPRGRPYLVMRLLPGRSLQAWVKEAGPFAVDEAVRIVERLCEGVAYAHRQGVLHRDLKPDNVLLAGLGEEPVLTDFGLALLVDRETRLTATGESMGTPVYMPPEQADGNLELVGPASDVYGLGAILYCLLTGVGPFRGGQLYEVLAAVLSKPHTPVSKLRPEVDSALSAIVDRCLQKDPRRRFATAKELGEALLGWHEGRAPRPGLSRGWKQAFAALAALVVVAGVAVALRKGRAPPGPAEGPVAPAEPKERERSLVIQAGPLEGVDTMVRAEDERKADNYGCHRLLHVAMSRKSGEHPAHSYLRFELRGRLPEKARLLAATLRLRKRGEPISRKRRLRLKRKNKRIHRDPPLPALVYGVRESWKEGTSGHGDHAVGMTWSSRPALESEPRARLEISRAKDEPEWVEVDVTALAKAWWGGGLPNHGLAIVPDLDRFSTGSSRKEFFSSDGDPADRPQLELRFVGRAPSPVQAEEERWGEARERARAAWKRVRTVPLAERPRAMHTVLRLAPFWGDAHLERGKLIGRLGLDGNRELARRAFVAGKVAERVAESPSDPLELGGLVCFAAIHSESRMLVPGACAILARLIQAHPKHDAALRKMLLDVSRGTAQAFSRFGRKGK